MAKEKFEGKRTRGEFLRIVDEIQIFLEYYQLRPYVHAEEVAYNQAVASLPDASSLPKNKFFWAYEVDETERSKAGQRNVFFGLITIYVYVSDGVQGEVRTVEIPSRNSFQSPGVDNHYEYDIDYDALANQLLSISEAADETRKARLGNTLR